MRSRPPRPRHPHAQPHPDPRLQLGPTNKQLRYLRALADERGQTFKTPCTRREASREIRRLLGTPVQDGLERAIEHDHRHDTPAGHDATRTQAGEITGYGANAHWTHTSREEDPS